MLDSFFQRQQINLPPFPGPSPVNPLSQPKQSCTPALPVGWSKHPQLCAAAAKPLLFSVFLMPACCSINENKTGALPLVVRQQQFTHVLHTRFKTDTSKC